MPANWWKACIAEGIGTFALIFIGAGSVIVNHFTNGGVGVMGIALAHGLTVAVVVSAIAHISGGHINPAVTIALLLTKRIETKLAAGYIPSQLLGAIVAGLALVALFPDASGEAVNLGATAVANGLNAFQGLVIEVILTFLLVFAVYGTAIDARGPKSIAGFGIGLTVALGALTGGPLTGASMNPARTLGPAVAANFWANHWIYWVGPIVGAVSAALVYEYGLLRGAREKA